MSPTLVLASTSPFRRALLDKLRLPYEVCAPEVDESRHLDESPEELVRRLAEAKARAVADRFPEALIIGSDQVACLNDRVLGKPGDRARAIEQLRAASGRVVRFLTGLALVDTRTGGADVLVEPFEVHFRTLSDTQIARYVDAEQPFNCAGSFKSEGFGITLFERLAGNDPNALVGLPLIRLVDMLEKQGITLP